MDPQRYDRIHEVFDRAKDRTGSELERLLEQECGSDAELRREVERLLDHDRTRATLAEAFAPGPHVEVGQVVGRYKLLEMLGEGGFGVVYMAEQREPVSRRVALKVIKLGMDTRQVIARFEAERQALAMMDHPNIARIFDAGATETGRPYFVMELVRGTSVTAYCDGKRLPLRARLELVAQICDALQHAHQKGVIHRDIKPSNVLVSTVGDRPVSKIIDFGIAKATSARLTEKTFFTDFRQMIGTPAYMSPEQAGDSPNEADTRTDVYSTGVLLYELLTGTTPFDSRRLRSAAFGELQRIIREVDPPKPSTRVSQDTGSLPDLAALRHAEPRKLGTMIRGELDWIVMKALEKDPARRYDSAGSMARDIHRYLDGEVIQAAPPSAVYRVRKFIRRNRGPALATLLLVIAVLAGLIGTSIGLVEAERGRVEAESQRDRANTQKDRADREAEQARAAESLANRKAYTATLLSAGDALAGHHYEKARFFLDAAPEELRGWEWRVFESRLDTSTRVLEVPISRPDRRPGANALIAHPDGRSCFVVRGFESPAAKRIELESGALLAEYEHPAGPERTASTGSEFFLSPDGARLHALSGRSEAGRLWVSSWDLGSGQRLHRTAVDPGRNITERPTISPDGARLALSDGDEVWLQDVQSGATLASGTAGLRVVLRMFSPDGELLAVADGRGGLELLDGHTLEPRGALEGHRNLITALDFSPDGRWLGSAAIDDTARVWDLRASPPSAVVLEHPQAVSSIRLSPSGARAATSCGDGALRVWDAGTGELESVATAADLIGGTLMFLPDGKTIAGRHFDGALRFWDVEAESTVNLRGHRGLLNGAAFAEGTGLIVSVGWDGWTGNAGCVRVWDEDTGDEVASWGRPGEIARSLAVSRDGRRAATTISPRSYPGMPEGAVRMDGVLILDLLTGGQTAVEGHAASLAFDPTSELLALAQADRLELRGARDGGLRRERTSGFEGMEVDHLAWSPDGRYLACSLTPRAGDAPERVREHLLLDPGSLDTVRRLDAGPVSFAPDAERLFAAAADGTVHVLRLGTWELLETIAEHGLSAPVFSADGARLATRLGGEGEILVWDAGTYDRVASLRRPGFVSSVAWSADGARLVGACGRTVCVWDAVPLGERVRRREARRSALEMVAQLTDRLFEELGEPARVLERLESEPSLSPLQLRAARQEVLRRGLASPPSAAPQRPGADEER